MAGSYFPSKDPALDTWLENFVQVASQNLTVLGISQTDIQAIQSPAVGFDTALYQMTAALAAYKAAAVVKHAARKKAEQVVRTYVKRFQANPAIPDTLRMALGIPVYKKPATGVVPVTPQNLQAIPNANGVNALNWKPNGNRPGVLYVVQAMQSAPGAAAGGGGAWTTIGVSTRARFAHTGCTPGIPMRYRVLAQRAEKASSASNEAGVYGG